MGTYTVHAGGTISRSSIKTFTMPAFTVPSGETFYRFKITISGGDYEGFGLRNDSADIGWNNWSTKKDKLHWSNGGQAKVWVWSASNRSVTINVTFETKADAKHTITCAVSPSGSGTLTASKTSAKQGTTITLTPAPATGYKLGSYTWPSSVTTHSGNTFEMPNSNVTITANFVKVDYTITRKVNMSGAGTVTTTVGGSTAVTAQMGNQVTLGHLDNTGYKFINYTTSPTVTISSSKFTMPASNITITGNYKKRSTATLSKSSLAGGSSAVLTISPEKTTYKHKYTLSFGSGMSTGAVTVAAGTTSVTISIPLSWCAQIPNATSKTGGTLTLETLDGTESVGTYEITGLTFTVPASVVPTIGTITSSIQRTIGGKTYNNIGNYYVQNHCGVGVSTSAAGAQSSTISNVVISLSGYSGTSYTKTITSGFSSISYTSGLLTKSGSMTITVKATDSRGRTATKTATFTVSAYNKPNGTLKVWRVDSSGNADDFGQYAKYQITKSFTAIGSNSLTTVSLKANGSTGTLSSNTGNILPSSRLTFNTTLDYTIELTLTDGMGETTKITAVLESARYIIHVNADGTKLGFMKAANKTIPSGKDSTLEVSGDTQIYIGNKTLEQFILDVVNGN